MICGIDRVILKDISELFCMELSETGVGDIPVSLYGWKTPTVLEMIKLFSNIELNDRITKTYKSVEAFALAGLVVDLNIFHEKIIAIEINRIETS